MDIWNDFNSELMFDLSIFQIGGRNDSNESKAFWGEMEKEIAEKADNMNNDSMKKNDDSMNTMNKNDFCFD
jgi:hypothetical protein